MNAANVLRMLFAVLLMAAGTLHAQERAEPVANAKGSSVLCLYELPQNEHGKRRWLNLGIVQYLEFSRNELRVYYGGGNLGSGHEAIFPIANSAQLDEILNKIKQAAASCAG